MHGPLFAVAPQGPFNRGQEYPDVEKIGSGAHVAKCAACGHDNRREARFCEQCGSALADTAAAPAGASLPSTLGAGRYTPRRLLGEGARKKVYLAVDERLGREVAVSVIKTEGLDDEGRIRVAREARSMARLGDHPTIVTVYDVGDDGGTPYIVSQYMPGGSLADRLDAASDGRLPIRDVLHLGEQLAVALGHAHAHSVVHRDLKPANVWLDAEGNARLGDFGLAVPLDASRITSEGLLLGTVAYLSPEQALGRTPDPKADLYSLGALLYECLCGRPPFLGDDAVAVISQHLNVAPIAPSWHNAGVPPGLDALVLGLLAKDPAERPASAAEVAKELARIRDLYDSHDTATAVMADAGRTALAQAEWGRFVGRADELAQLRALFDESLSGRTRVAMVVGEPGIGKTRLVEELSAYASMRGASVWWGHCYEGEGGLPYLPFVEAIRTYVRTAAPTLAATASSGLAEVATLVAEVREHVPGLPSLPALEGDAERLRLFEGVAAFVRAACRERPAVLVLDDLHWADKPTLLLLQHLARTVQDARLLVLGTYRDVDLDRSHPLADAIANLRRQRLYERVLLRGLPRGDVKALIEAIGGQETPDGFADLIFQETEGNPFFVSEILRHLVETGAVKREGGQWVGMPDAVAANLPEGIREVIGRRLDSLSAGCNDMLSVACAMPGGFTVDVVGDVADIDENTMLDLLDEALAAQLLRERRERPGTYEFSHALIRQTLYGELTTPRRVRMHRRITEALEGRAGDAIDVQLPALAYHSYEAAPGGNVEKAVTYSERAARQAMSQAAYEEAARYYEMALQAMEHGTEPMPARRADLLIELGRARAWGGDRDGSHVACVDAAAIARERADGMQLGRAALQYMGLQGVSAAGEEDHVLVGLFEEAIDALREIPESQERDALLAEVLVYLGAYLGFRHPAPAAALIEEALAMAQRSGAKRPLAWALLNTTLWTNLDEDERERRRYEAAALAEEAGDLHLSRSLNFNLASNAAMHARRDELDRLMAENVRIAEVSRSPQLLANATIDRASMAAIDGRYAEAEELFLTGLRLARPVGDPTMIANVGIGLSPVYRELGRLGDLEAPTRRAVEQAQEIPAYRGGLLQILIETGQMDEAAAELDDLVHRPLEWETVADRYHFAMLSEAAARLGSREAAERLVEVHASDTHPGDGILLGLTAYHGARQRYLGFVKMTLGDVDEAVVMHERALDVHERMRAPGWLARSKYDLAKALLTRRGDGDAERAARLLGEALDTAHELGMVRLLEEVLAVRLDIQGVQSGVSATQSIDAVSAAVSADRPDLVSHAGADGQVTIGFSDIVGYSSLNDRLGDARTHEVLRAHNEIVRRELADRGGTEVKSEGDGFMFAFADPTRALRFARDVQHRLAERTWPPDIGTVQVRMGFHIGQVIRDADDFYGRTVITAARIAAQAAAGEVLVSDAVREATSSAMEFGPPRELTLKGLSGTHRTHPLLV